ncbi:hypothetical protein OKJ48_39380 [Streptomyces kunmingensis]|uniref:DUF2231 domain-containing protein n=1 Tax=Streptomyces kunmingensis TaxID=68225 RepID=A0ABU6CPV4_9ACTN|nr:hypothetical protein [Streptomyces kunmingensis]MEB3966246.1 hypothetical protein [Streptomyces kunmingensis]
MNIPAHNLVSLGGVTIGLCLFAWQFTRWWAGHKKKNLKALRHLAPFLLCLAYGMLLILCAGGLLGLAADYSLWGASAIGDAVLVYGVGGTSPAVTRTSNIALTPGGHSVVVIGTVVLLAVWTRTRGWRWDLFSGVAAGVTLGLASGIAGVAGYVLSPVVSTLGDAVGGLL